jgi:hypothetical protein
MKTTTAVLLLGLVLLVASAPALADVVPLSQNRTLCCNAYAEDANGSDSNSDQASAPDFTGFADAVSANIWLDEALASGSANQSSAIGASIFTVTGGCAANGEAYDFDGFAYGDAGGSTSFSCTFEVTATTTFVLSGWLEASDDGSAQLTLSGPGFALDRDAGFNNILDLDESGTLAPGVYTFTVGAVSSAYGDAFNYGYAYGSFDLYLAFSAPAAIPGDREGLALALSPNPFSGRTQIAYAAPAEKPTSLEIFDVRGRKVRRLSAYGTSTGGLHWDGKDGAGRVMAPGVYFVVLKSGADVRREKVTLLR